MPCEIRALRFTKKNIIGPLLWLLCNFPRIIFKLMDFVWPKENNLLVFSGHLGQKFSDNTKYLFQKFVKHYDKEFQIVWITCNKSLIDDINLNHSGHFQVIYQYSLAGILTLLRAKVIFYMMGDCDIPFVAFSQKTVTIQLWHGTPIKRLLWARGDGDNWRSSVIKHLKMGQSQYTYWICNSAIDRNATALCTSLPIDKVVITGYPRNDYLLDHKRTPSPELLVRFPYLQKTVILYAPTWREKNEVQFFPFPDFHFEELNTFLEVNDAYLLLRGHWAEKADIMNEKTKSKSLAGDRVIAATQTMFEDVQELLPFVDILISDYSGIWIDYLLLDRPLIFVPYDLEDYERIPGLLYNYHQITPGPMVSINKEFIEAMQAYIQNPGKDSEKRACVRRMFHEFNDGLSYKRIYELIQKSR